MIREINGVRYICLSPENETKFKELAMNRKDLRSAEQDWRATKQPTNRPMPDPKRSLRVVTVLKWLVICMLVIVAGTYLYQSQKQCESALGDSIYCVD